MTETRVRSLLVAAALVGALAWLVADRAYGARPALPAYAPVTLAVLGVAELALARVVRDRLRGRRDERGRPLGRPLHPVQVARAAVLAKASSPTGALALGAYGGLLAWTAPRADSLAAARHDALVAGASALAAAALVAAALLLERSCRLPPEPETGLADDDEPDWP